MNPVNIYSYNTTNHIRFIQQRRIEQHQGTRTAFCFFCSSSRVSTRFSSATSRAVWPYKEIHSKHSTEGFNHTVFASGSLFLSFHCSPHCWWHPYHTCYQQAGCTPPPAPSGLRRVVASSHQCPCSPHQHYTVAALWEEKRGIHNREDRVMFKSSLTQGNTNIKHKLTSCHQPLVWTDAHFRTSMYPLAAATCKAVALVFGWGVTVPLPASTAIASWSMILSSSFRALSTSIPKKPQNCSLMKNALYCIDLT